MQDGLQPCTASHYIYEKQALKHLQLHHSQCIHLPLPSDPKYCGHVSPKKDTPKTENTNIIIRRSATILAMSGRDKIIVCTMT